MQPDCVYILAPSECLAPCRTQRTPPICFLNLFKDSRRLEVFTLGTLDPAIFFRRNASQSVLPSLPKTQARPKSFPLESHPARPHFIPAAGKSEHRRIRRQKDQEQGVRRRDLSARVAAGVTSGRRQSGQRQIRASHRVGLSPENEFFSGYVRSNVDIHLESARHFERHSGALSWLLGFMSLIGTPRNAYCPYTQRHC